MVRSLRYWLLAVGAGSGLLLVSLVSCNEVAVTLPAPDSVLVYPAQLTMFPGDVATVSAQLLDQNKRLLDPFAFPVSWTSDNRAVATVAPVVGTGNANVTATAPGTAKLTVSAGTKSATIDVTVSGEGRIIIRSLTITPKSVTTDVQAQVAKWPVVEFRALDGNGTERCNNVAPLFRSNTSVATGTNLGTCRIRVNPAGAGTTYLVASVNNARDSVLVDVTNIAYSAVFSLVPNDTLLKAGDTVAYEVTITDQASKAAAGVAVNFSVTGGSPSAKSVATNASGKATVQWYLPQSPIAAGGTAHNIGFRAELPNGALTGLVSPPAYPRNVVPGPATRVVFLGNFRPAGGPLDTLGATANVSLGLFPTLFAQSFDRFGNVRQTNTLFSATDPSVIRASGVSGTSLLAQLFGDRVRTETVTASEGSGAATMAITWTAGPLAVFTILGSDVVFTGQPTFLLSGCCGFSDTVVYAGGAGASAYPKMTLRSDTVAFAWFNGDNWDVGLVKSDGSNASAPVSTIPSNANVDERASALWGFPVFRTATGNPAGAVLFLSNRDSTKIANAKLVWDLLLRNRTATATTKSTKVTNTHPDSSQIRYRGLSLSPDERKVLVVTDQVGSRRSQVYEITIATGAITQITSNTSVFTIFRYATYSPDGTKIYLDRVNGGIRELVEKSGTTYTVIKSGSIGVELQPAFNPSDANVMAYVIFNGGLGDQEVRLFPLNNPSSPPLDVGGRRTIEWFSWSKR